LINETQQESYIFSNADYMQAYVVSLLVHTLRKKKNEETICVCNKGTSGPQMRVLRLSQRWCFKSRSSGFWCRVVLWRWRQRGPPKRWYPITTLHGVTTQKI